MLKTVVAGLTALFVTASSLAYAQAPSTAGSEQEDSRLSAADLNALTDARIAIVKAALQLTPEQAKYWPALEEAIRNRATGRQVRLAALAARQREPRDSDPVEVMRRRAETLAARSAELKQLADAWQPLAATLTPEQKQRLRVLGVRVLRVLHNAMETRRMQDEDSDEEYHCTIGPAPKSAPSIPAKATVAGGIIAVTGAASPPTTIQPCRTNQSAARRNSINQK